jgi:hypothetical protein
MKAMELYLSATLVHNASLDATATQPVGQHKPSRPSTDDENIDLAGFDLRCLRHG